MAEDAQATTVLDQLQRAIDEAPIGVVSVDGAGLISGGNKLGRVLLGLDNPAGQSLPDLLENADAFMVALGASTQNASPAFEGLIKATGIPCDITLVPFNADIRLAYLTDLSRHRALEAQYRQSQKMQAIGQLAGGVAHDFNNLLTAMLGYCDLLLERHGAGDPSFPDIVQIKQNANRAVNLVRQLLAVSRQQAMSAEQLDLRDVVGDLSELVRRLVGERISVEAALPESAVSVLADKGQLEQVLVNLAVNARDAMSASADGGGKLTLSVGQENLTRALDHKLGQVPAGLYGVIEVRDTGTGIPDEALEKIFEPFFTTKPAGSGTGLGLATVLGIVEQLGGYVCVETAPGQGTAFRIFLPLADPKAAVAARAKADESGEEAAPSGPLNILLVEDERAVRKLATRALEEAGHMVKAAADAEEAIELLEDGTLKPDVLVTDVVMPGMDGPALYRAIADDQPGLKVLFISGYAEEEARKSIGAIAESATARFLAKPFSLNALKTAINKLVASG